MLATIGVKYYHSHQAPARRRGERIGHYVCYWQILLQKSFWEGERKFLEPLMRFARGEVRDHFVSSEIDHGPP
jgi:hypothetical protein